MDNMKKVSIWLINKPDEFINGFCDLVALGFDLDKNTARQLITAVAIYKGVIEE